MLRGAGLFESLDHVHEFSIGANEFAASIDARASFLFVLNNRHFTVPTGTAATWRGPVR